MAAQTITLNVPAPLYQKLKRRADATLRTVEDELLTMVATAAPLVDELPQDLEDAISPMALLDDEALWRAARTHISADAAERMEELHTRRRREGLTGEETQALAMLVAQYERSMLVRAQAAALLKQRGHDVAALLESTA